MRAARFRAAVVTLLIAVSAIGVAGEPAATAAPSTYTHGFDVSWPQCHGHAAGRMPRSGARYVILGLTHGTGHTTNPCLRSQLGWARQHHAKVGGYLVASYPSRRQLGVAGRIGHCHGRTLCQLRTDGARQSLDALRTLHRVHMRSPMVWLDVEFRSTHGWHRSHRRNRAVIEGMVASLRRNHKRFGVYTTSYMWHAIVGHYRLRVPQWLPSGVGNPRRTKPMCRRTATGGRTWIVQFTRRLDEDLTCPILDPTRSHVRGRSSGHGFLLNRVVA
ncbi:MAG TPA: hypothetical protein VG650_11210 [Mycobacteriales bacterium]|nr:hypothetical protein [Mycobacteriales bacterium]